MSNKKIWSVPIAVLALALMIVGGMLASSVVRAQTPDPSLEKASVVGAVNGDADIADATVLATLTIGNWVGGTSGVVPEIEASAPGVTAFDNPAIIGGPTFTDATNTTATPIFEVAAGTVAGTTLPLEISLTSAASTAANADPATLNLASSYSFQVRTVIDRDITADAPADTDSTVSNDRDIMLTGNVTINVMKVTDNNLQFDVVLSKAVKGAVVSGLRNPIGSTPLEWEVTGIGSRAKLLSIEDSGASGDFVVKETPAGSGKFRLFVENSGAAALTSALTLGGDGLTLTYDEDTSVDSDADADPATTDPAANADVTIDITGVVTPRDALALSGGNLTGNPPALPDSANGIHYDFTIPSSTVVNTPIGYFAVTGGIAATDPDGTPGSGDETAAEYLDGIVTGADAAPFRVNDADMSLVYDGSPALEVKTYTFDLTVNGDAGMAGRSVIGKVQVTVTASNVAPDAPGTFMATVPENVSGKDVDADTTATPPVVAVAGLVSPGTEVGDASTGVSANDGDSLKYYLSGTGAGVFAINEDTGMITVGTAGISDSDGGPTDDDPDATYTRSDNGVLADDTDEFSDVTYTFNIRVSDGISANDKSIAATVRVDVNEPVTVSSDAMDHEYQTTDVQNHEIVDVMGYLNSDDAPSYVAIFDPLNPPFGIQTDGSINVNYPGPARPVLDDPLTTDVDESWDPEEDGWDITVLIGDDFVNSTPPTYTDEDGNEQDYVHTSLEHGVDVVLTFNIKLMPGPPLQSFDLEFNVDENSPAGTSVGTIVVDQATTYAVISGTGGARDDFAVNADTGEITVVNPRDYDADGAQNNVVLLVDAFGANGIRLGAVIAGIAINDIDEDPMITDLIVGDTPMQSEIPWVYESAQIGAPVLTKPVGAAGGAATDAPTVIMANDPEDRTITFSISEGTPPFAINASTGALTVSGALDAEVAPTHTFTVKAADPAGNYDTAEITVHVANSNEAPSFTSPTGDDAVTSIPEDTGTDTVIFTFTAEDEDGDDLTFKLREGQSDDLFEIKNTANTIVDGVEVWSGDLHAKVALDFEDATYDSRVHVEVQDPDGLSDTLLLTVNLENLNDEAPAWDEDPKTELTVAENDPRGKFLANYSATDRDNLADGITYTLTGTNEKAFEIMDNGDLVTLESIDHDSATPCAANVCNITVNASDGAQSLSVDVRITVVDAEDSVSTLDIRKANPVPGPNAGLPDSALSGAKTTRDADVPERPADLPATITSYDLDNDGTPDNVNDAVNFVETEWANWGTVLLIEITSESPDSDCGNGNQCVVVDLESDSADDSLSVIAYRSAHQENKFLAAVKLVGRSASAGDGQVDPAYLMPTDHNAAGGIRPRDMGATPGDTPVYKHTDGTVARLQVDEEDEINIGFDNLRDSIDVENDPPEIESFAPAHESAFDDADVDYSFRVTDSLSGIPSPEDLPDNDGDEDYIPVIAVVSGTQCERPEINVGNNRTIRADVAQCNTKRGIHEYDATTASRGDWGYIAVREDKDFDDIDNGYEIETTLVLDEDKVFYVTFVAVDRAGNMAYFDPDGSDDEVEYAEIVIDVDEPDLYEARAGVTWDEGDEEYDDDRSVIQVIFNDLTELNPATVEIDDFVVEGHTIVAANVYEQPDDWSDTSRYATGGELRYRNPDGLRLRQSIETSVFLHLEDELQADETPDVTLVPNGIEDAAGNEQDDGEAEADDWISPAFTIVSIVSPRETTENPDKVLAGDGDEVVFNVTVDERLSTARPTVTVSYVDASMVDTKGTATCDNGDGDNDMHDGKRKRGEITMNTSGESSALCANNDIATDHNLKTTVEKVTNTEWIVTVGEPKGTGYYNFHIAGKDRSTQQNPGSEGVDPDNIVTDFYDSDGDVNMDDAVFYEGDINLPKPNVRLGGVDITDNEPSVEYRSRLFLEIDFTRRYEDAVACEDLPNLSDNYRLANCMNENSEYAEDSFDDIVVTSFVLDGVDITDSVRTTDGQTFLVTLENIGLGDHEVEIQAMDQAGNELEDTLEIDFEVSDRDPFEKRLSPGWNLISLPGEPADSSIASVIGPDVEVRTVYTYNPVVPGGWQVAVRETLDSEWQGDLTEITGQRGYWILSDAIQDWEVNIPRLAGGAVGTGTPIQPPVIPLYAGWNLIPVTDVKGNALDHNTPIDAAVYLQSLEDGIEAARVLGFDTIRNEWYTVLDGDMMSPGMGTNLLIGSGYWVFVRNATALVPGGVASSGGSSD